MLKRLDLDCQSCIFWTTTTVCGGNRIPKEIEYRGCSIGNWIYLQAGSKIVIDLVGFIKNKDFFENNPYITVLNSNL